MQCNIRKKIRVSYECLKDSPKKDKIVRNLRSSLLDDLDDLTSINPPI